MGSILAFLIFSLLLIAAVVVITKLMLTMNDRGSIVGFVAGVMSILAAANYIGGPLSPKR